MISVVVPAYNAEGTLEQCLNSIKASFTVENYEVIIVDDGSINSCAYIVAQFNDNFKYLRTENKGVSAARNAGVNASNGNIIAFCDSDDVWLVDKMKKQLNVFNNNKLKILGGGSVGRLYKLPHTSKIFNITKKYLPFQWWPHVSTLVITSDFFHEVGGFDVNMRYAEDGDFLVRVSQKVDIPVLEDSLVKHGIHKDFNFSSGLSANQEEMLKGELKIINSYYTATSSIVYALFILVKYVYRKFFLLIKSNRSV